MPAVPLGRQPAGDGRGDGADIAGGVQQRKAAVATRIVVGVEFAKQAADIGFEQAIAADNDRQRDVQAPCGGRLNAQHHVAESHQQRPGNHRRAVAEQAVGKPAAENRGNVNQRCVSAEQADGVAVVKAKLVGEVEDE